jgi:hypothetical protein
LAFGDSNVAGCEAIPELDVYYEKLYQGRMTIHETDEFSKEYSFANIMAKKLEIPCYNFAMSGSSNARSLRILIKEILNYPNSLVLFGYTCTDRNEFFYPDSGYFYSRDSDFFIQTGMQWASIDPEINKQFNPINSVYIEKILRPYNNLREIMFCVDAICRLYSDGLIHIPIFEEKIPKEFKNPFSFEGFDNYRSWAKSKGYNLTANGHYDYKTNIALATLLMKFLELNDEN